MNKPKPKRTKKGVRMSITFRPDEVRSLDWLRRRIAARGGKRLSRLQVLEALLGAAARSGMGPDVEEKTPGRKRRT